MAAAGDPYFLLFTALLLLLLLYLSWKAFFPKRRRRSEALAPPPSPPGLPIIGHLHLVGKVLPTSFQSLARNHGPLLTLRLGFSTCVVASGADVAKEMFKTHELNFSSRPELGSSQYSIYRGSNFSMSPYGEYWRFMKKLTMTRLLSLPRLILFSDVLGDERLRLLVSAARRAGEGKVFDLRRELTTLTNNTICRMAMSTRCSAEEKEAEEIRRLVEDCMDLGGKLSSGDVLGPFRALDFSGNGKKLFATLTKYDELVEKIKKEHEEETAAAATNREDLLDILLEIHNDPGAEIKLSKTDIKSFLLNNGDSVVPARYRYGTGTL